MMKRSLLMSFAVAAGLVLAPATLPAQEQEQAQAVTCDGTYTVRRGDTLSLIAARLLGRSQAYQLIYAANAATVGPDPASIEVGAELRIPCPEGISLLDPSGMG